MTRPPRDRDGDGVAGEGRTAPRNNNERKPKRSRKPNRPPNKPKPPGPANVPKQTRRK